MRQAKKRRKPDLVALRCSTVQTVVYRVQDSDGRGPWKPGFSNSWVADREDESEFDYLKPIFVEFPKFNSMLRPGYHVGVGCTSLEQLRRWITRSEYETLRKYGYRCVAILADRIVAESDIQCVFERSKPLRKGCKPARLHP